MKNKLIVPRIDAIPYAAAIPSAFAAADVKYVRLECLNWKDFDYLPEVGVALAHSGDSLYIHYKVVEDSVKGDWTEDFCNVWEDSCCELFISADNDGKYYNIECNCIGALYFCVGEGRSDRRRADAASIERHCSLGRERLGLVSGKREWEVALKVPATAFFEHNVDFCGAVMAGNIYKCGKTMHNHFVSMFPIGTERPDFHRPEFFGIIEFE